MAHASETGPMPFPVLLADIGGTNGRFALLEDKQAKVTVFPFVHTKDYPSPVEAARAVLEAAGAPAPRSAVLDLAGPLDNERIVLTNAAWEFQPRRLVADLGLEELVLVNDFEALALALPVLAGDDIVHIGGGATHPSGPRVVVGPGTGLGQAGLIHSGQHWVPIPSEAGHADFGPVTDEDFALWAKLEKSHGRITPETVISGPGLLRLYHAVVAVNGVAPIATSPAEVTDAADGGDPLAIHTLRLFTIYLGRFAGDLALTFLATGGVFLAGGIAPKIENFLTDGTFRAAFEDKAPLAKLVSDIPTLLIRHPLPAIEGLAAFARDPRHYYVPANHRHKREG